MVVLVIKMVVVVGNSAVDEVCHLRTRIIPSEGLVSFVEIDVA